ncbi:hypothetical protein [Aquabacterium sp.]|uniref:hypothetical protein n=1 Tax=Aquabacterium sp. TaxID=1872578 RepID=UPI002C6996DA|nr:hypothetical protein [Aquabacterium sp.]HSW08335.1 hypothetical protein [Aquabacterium sp.]
MDIGPLMPSVSHAAAPDAAAWSAAAEPEAIGEPSQAGLQIASLQAGTVQPARPPAVALADAAMRDDPALPLADAHNGFALPADQLTPAMLSSLHVQAGDAWALLHPGVHAPATPRPGTRDEADLHDERGDSPARDHEDDDTDTTVPEADACDPQAQPEPAPAEPWCDTLTGVLNHLLAAPNQPLALQTAADEWGRGRCVVLICPRSHAAAGPAWGFVLWPRGARRSAAHPQPHHTLPCQALLGQRVDARLQWAGPPAAVRWCHVRVVKDHHPRRGRQLLAIDATGSTSGPVPCEVQLGPVWVGAPRWREASVRIDAVKRFWSALGGQWSVFVVVCSRPLSGTPALDIVEA